ncbi:MAG: PTS-dependent dihydroxyacetone kinase phosphotransferase subunit DhaM [Enterococcaceae bacterium]|jgi:dihydroxyacetone kinase phosphotransfer subunit|nr:PTS-dependent dihydroxyacetone kinase phosphotransferase subunit DhaM [Enterococcaceae bacterium]MCI1919002.1 PTS-dependent dihydroxyacetone kinase phosphotransferase subunit DhaM [Enterococcaceae bacterium]
MTKGVVLVSHTTEIPAGLKKLIAQVAADVPVTTAGGTDDDRIGTSAGKIAQAIAKNPADEVWAFYDLGSAKMNLQLAQSMTQKKVTIFDTAFVEGAYTACALLAVNTDPQEITAQLAPLKIK